MIPQTEQALLEKAQSIAGLTFGELADELNIPVPPDLKRDKGWVGMLLESALGATAGSKAEQDFSHLGIELKNLTHQCRRFSVGNHVCEPCALGSKLRSKLGKFARSS